MKLKLKLHVAWPRLTRKWPTHHAIKSPFLNQQHQDTKTETSEHTSPTDRSRIDESSTDRLPYIVFISKYLKLHKSVFVVKCNSKEHAQECCCSVTRCTKNLNDFHRFTRPLRFFVNGASETALTANKIRQVDVRFALASLDVVTELDLVEYLFDLQSITPSLIFLSLLLPSRRGFVHGFNSAVMATDTCSDVNNCC